MVKGVSFFSGIETVCEHCNLSFPLNKAHYTLCGLRLCSRCENEHLDCPICNPLRPGDATTCRRCSKPAELRATPCGLGPPCGGRADND